MLTGILSGYLSRMRAASACRFSAEWNDTVRIYLSRLLRIDGAENSALGCLPRNRDSARGRN